MCIIMCQHLVWSHLVCFMWQRGLIYVKLFFSLLIIHKFCRSNTKCHIDCIRKVLKWVCGFLGKLYIWTTVCLDESRPKIFLLFSHLIDEKFASFLTYLKSWWKVVLVFGKEHADWSNIGGVMIGWSWKIKFVKTHFFWQNVNLKS